MKTGRKAFCAAVMAGAIAAVQFAGVTAQAAERPQNMDDATWARLQDNVMEYNELPDLVRCYNPTYQQVQESIMPMINASRETAAKMQRTEELKTMKDSARELKKSLDRMDPATQAGTLEYQALYAQYATLNAAVNSTEQGIRAISRTAGTMESETSSMRQQTLASLTAAAQQLFIGYNQAVASRELVNAAAELAQAAAQSAVTQRSVGMATDNDVLSAQQALLSAQGQQMSIEDMITSLRQNLCVMTGWSYDALPEIGTVPAPDLGRIAAMNPDTDITEAIKASYSLDSLDDSLSGKAMYRKNRTISEAEEDLKIQLHSLYQTVLADQASYEAANTALAAAGITMDSTQRQYSLGMIGRLQFLQAQLGFLQQKMTADSAALTLTQSILAYDWALDGIILSEQTAQ